MIEPVISQALTSAGPAVTNLPLREQALASDVSRFQAALQGEPGLQLHTQASTGNAVGSEAGTLGDAILSGLKSASDDLGQRFNHAQTLLGNQDLSVADAMRLQLSIMQASMQYELINKGVSKMSQNIDQVLKTQ